jgi:hypothetical protein
VDGRDVVGDREEGRKKEWEERERGGGLLIKDTEKVALPPVHDVQPKGDVVQEVRNSFLPIQLISSIVLH